MQTIGCKVKLFAINHYRSQQAAQLNLVYSISLLSIELFYSTLRPNQEPSFCLKLNNCITKKYPTQIFTWKLLVNEQIWKIQSCAASNVDNTNRLH